MKAASSSQIKQALSNLNAAELSFLLLRLARFKNENKELLSYLLFQEGDEERYVNDVKELISEEFKLINTSSYYFIKKSIRKILRMSRKFIRYSGKAETEIEILLHFCAELAGMQPAYTENKVLRNLMSQLHQKLKVSIKKLHEDLQYDYLRELAAIK